MSKKQNTIIQAAKKNGGFITTNEAVKLVGWDYYHNAGKYVGEILARMVAGGKLLRAGRGKYKLPIHTGVQTELFNKENEQ